MELSLAYQISKSKATVLKLVSLKSYAKSIRQNSLGGKKYKFTEVGVPRFAKK